ncbi:MAG TPA: heparan-alpha-glucosaminide N-acetyltransferase domain-containing protein [Pyrinomonadaceae bacterium]|nr:heparan-alpha-glucosaminide N-acetyltransferase domain-containing protein [Pyrinomonadaceae bacterium]
MDTTRGNQNDASGAGRLLSLDAFRGITVAAMILVNNPGSWDAVYAPLKHAEWHGWTPTDLVFPFFLFIVGVSITLALARRAESAETRRDLYVKILKRSLIIFGLGLVLAGFPYFNLETIRIPGVLQRIAVCYLVASIIFLKTDFKGQAVIVAVLLVAYWLLMTLTPAPGYGTGDLSLDGNLAAYFDRAILAGHIYKPNYDPEGILSTLPAIATTLIGVLAGHWLRSPRPPLDKVKGMVVAGVAGVLLGWLWHQSFPINKPLWTSSYVVLTGGMASLFLALCYWLIDIKGFHRWALPFVVSGVNALAAFFLSGLVARVMTIWKVSRAGGSQVTLKNFLYDTLFASWASPINASLLFALCFVLVFLGLMTVLYRRKIFIKV